MSNSKNFMSIRSKLLAAIAMLLVASFMVVSSTYAWFTLSTAPEVTGITTQIGANGNLEIALNTGAETIGNYVGGTNTSTVDRNTTWGNLVDLSSADYGLSSVVLKPSALLLSTASTQGNLKIDPDNPMVTPEYGSDGRVSALAANTSYGKYNATKKGFETTDEYGVRAIGTVSSMTIQLMQYRTALSALKAALDTIAGYAEASLETLDGKVTVSTGDGTGATTEVDISIGGRLVGILLKGGLDAEATYTAEELAAINKMITELNKVLPALETAIKNYTITGITKAYEGKSEIEFTAIREAFDSNWETIFGQMTREGSVSIDGTNTFDVPAQLASVVATYNRISTALSEAGDAYNEAITDTVTPDSITWAEVRDILSGLMDIDGVTIGGATGNGLTIDDIKGLDDQFGWATANLMQGVNVRMPAGSGVYADIASVNKNVRADFVAPVDVSYEGKNFTLPNMNIAMFTTLETANITPLTNYVPVAPVKTGATSEAEAIDDTYAYVLDFAFRTNAANSNLLLQQAAKDRVYGDNTEENSQTWGGGSYMELTPAEGFMASDLVALMENIRIVFINPLTGDILAGAKLDTENATTSNGAVKAYVKLCAVEAATITGSNNMATLKFGDVKDASHQVITALEQNTVARISAYVYLDGETVTNADVAALTSTSANGKLNLQFASDAALKPMEYSADFKEVFTTSAPATPETPNGGQGTDEEQGNS